MQSLKKIENFILEEQIGEGQFGQVFRARQIGSEKIFAVKVLRKTMFENNKLMRRQLKTETSIMNAARHRNLMHLHKSFETERNYYLILDYCEGGDLETYMRKHKIKYFSEFESVHILKQIMNGFQELRRKNVIHRDLKLENIFVHNGTIILGDFGAAKVVKEMTSTTVGTPLSMAPEVLEGDDYNHMSDIWSIGIVFYRLLIGKAPFFAFSIGELKKKALTQSGKNLVFKNGINLCKVTKDLLRRLLEPDPLKRISWKEIFSHEVFSDSHKFNCFQMQSAPTSPILSRFSDDNFTSVKGIQANFLNIS